jgi:hypothetical protein
LRLSAVQTRDKKLNAADARPKNAELLDLGSFVGSGRKTYRDAKRFPDDALPRKPAAARGRRTPHGKAANL